MFDAPEGGAALVVDEDGRVRSVVRDDLGLGTVVADSSLFELLDGASRVKADAFLAALSSRNAAFGWELHGAVGGGHGHLQLAGARTADGYLVIVSPTLRGLEQLTSELMRINNDHVNALRSLAKDFAEAAAARVDSEHDLYAEMTRINNELANVQRELVQANGRLADLNREKDRLLSMTSHDLRTPIGVIQSYAAFLEEDLGATLDPAQGEMIGKIEQTSRFMLLLIDDLLDVSAIESGALALERTPTDLARLVAESVAVNRVLASAKEIEIRSEVPDVRVSCAVDRRRIEQVMNNLIGNAVKFSSRGSSIRVALAVDADRVSVAVADHGPGIAAGEIATLFDPFAKGATRPTGGERGTGLGLAIVQRLVEAHGGTIDVESVVGEGSTFTFRLPRGPESGPG